MRVMILSGALTLLAITVSTTGCATRTSSDTFNQSEVGRQQSVEWGVVRSVRAVTIQNDSRGIATVTGAVLGGIAGSTLGSGRRANTAGAVAGTAAGGAVGSAASRGARAGVEITVELESGRSIAVAQDGHPNDFREGDRVQVTTNGAITRITR
jgi:outer membrane lipoprotein SlyB